MMVVLLSLYPIIGQAAPSASPSLQAPAEVGAKQLFTVQLSFPNPASAAGAQTVNLYVTVLSGALQSRHQ